MVWDARLARAGSAGWTAAATRNAATSSCSSKSQLNRSRCHGTLAWRSRISSGQRCRAETILVGRRIHEFMTVETLTLSRALELIQKGEIRDGKTAVLILFAAGFRARL